MCVGVDYYLLALNPTLLYPPMLSIFSMGGAVGWASWLLGSSITSSLGISPENLGTDPAGGGAPPVNQSIINLSITSFQSIANHSFNHSIPKTPCQSISIIYMHYCINYLLSINMINRSSILINQVHFSFLNFLTLKAIFRKKRRTQIHDATVKTTHSDSLHNVHYLINRIAFIIKTDYYKLNT